MSSFILTASAEKDLHQIWRYTYHTWGLNQADHYLDLLEQKCADIHQEKALWKSLEEIEPGLYALRCEHHYLFFLHDESQVPIIIAILHERMNLLERIRNRLR